MNNSALHTITDETESLNHCNRHSAVASLPTSSTSQTVPMTPFTMFVHTRSSMTRLEFFTGTKADWNVQTLLPFGLPYYGMIPPAMSTSKLSPKAFEDIVTVGTDLLYEPHILHVSLFQVLARRMKTKKGCNSGWGAWCEAAARDSSTCLRLRRQTQFYSAHI